METQESNNASSQEIPTSENEAELSGDQQPNQQKNADLSNNSSPLANNDEGSLLEDDFSVVDAREELERTGAQPHEDLMKDPDGVPNREKASPIFWLVGFFCLLAIGVIVAWLLAK